MVNKRVVIVAPVELLLSTSVASLAVGSMLLEHLSIVQESGSASVKVHGQ